MVQQKLTYSHNYENLFNIFNIISENINSSYINNILLSTPSYEYIYIDVLSELFNINQNIDDSNESKIKIYTNTINSLCDIRVMCHKKIGDIPSIWNKLGSKNHLLLGFYSTADNNYNVSVNIGGLRVSKNHILKNQFIYACNGTFISNIHCGAHNINIEIDNPNVSENLYCIYANIHSLETIIFFSKCALHYYTVFYDYDFIQLEHIIYVNGMCTGWESSNKTYISLSKKYKFLELPILTEKIPQYYIDLNKKRSSIFFDELIHHKRVFKDI